MDQRVTVITLGVDDLEAMKKFYIEKFGWKLEAQAKHIAFFKLNGMLLSLFGRKDLATFTGKPLEESGFRPFMFAYMVNSKEEVEDFYKQFTSRGIEIIMEPKTPPFGGYYFLFADIEGNVWEIAWNPMIILDESGNVSAHLNIDNY